MSQSARVIAVSTVAASLYLQANGSEVLAIGAYVFDTIGYDKADYVAYNMAASYTLNLSLKTMQNRATVAKALQDKYGAKVAGYPEHSHECIVEFVNFLVYEMSVAGAYRRHSEDIGNFLSGVKPAHIQREEKAHQASEVRRVLQETQAAKDAKIAQDKALNAGDTSGTADAAPATPQPEGTPVGNGVVSGNDAVETLPSPLPVNQVETAKDVQIANLQSRIDNMLVAVELNAEGGLTVTVADSDKVSIAELEDVIAALKDTVRVQKQAAAKLLKKAA